MQFEETLAQDGVAGWREREVHADSTDPTIRNYKACAACSRVISSVLLFPKIFVSIGTSRSLSTFPGNAPLFDSGPSQYITVFWIFQNVDWWVVTTVLEETAASNFYPSDISLNSR